MMKKIFSLLAIVLFTASMSFGQAAEQKQKEIHRADKKLEKLTEQLNLTEDQVAAIAQINQEMMTQRKSLNKSQKKERRDMRKEINEKYKAVLTPEQYQKLQELQAKDKRKEGRKAKNGSHKE